MPHSGLQREVLSLYRKLLRAAQRKQPQLIQHVKEEFRRESGGSRSDVNHIEWLLRRGHKQLTLFSQRNVKQITFQQPAGS